MNVSKKFIAGVLGVMLIFNLCYGFQVSALNVWATVAEAGKAQKEGKYDIAIKKYELAIPEFSKKKDDVNTALMYQKLAQCYAEISNYDKAVANWEKEGQLWDKLGKTQDKIIAYRKASYLQSTVKLFVEKKSEAVGSTYYHKAKYEPVFGAYIGAYAESDKAVHDAKAASKWYFDEFPKLTGKKHAAYLLYIDYGLPFSHYIKHFNKAKEQKVAIQLALQPHKGLDEVKDDEYLRQFAREAAKTEVPIFLRFANEMNEPSAPWFDEPKKYIEKFRIVADVFHQEAPNVVMSWAPNWYPQDTVDAYYPGDKYVDWVGVSIYKSNTPELDPLKKGIDRESYVDKFERIYNTYAKRKPIYISEGAVSYTHITTGKDVTEWATKEMENFFAYLPMLYPGIKGFFWFDTTNVINKIPRSYLLSANDKVLAAYKKGIENPFYLSDMGEKAPVFYEEITKSKLTPGKQKINTYVKTVNPNVLKVVYSINGKVVGQGTALPWSAEVDFKAYAGKEITIKVEVIGKDNKVLTTKEIKTAVGK